MLEGTLNVTPNGSRKTNAALCLLGQHHWHAIESEWDWVIMACCVCHKPEKHYIPFDKQPPIDKKSNCSYRV